MVSNILYKYCITAQNVSYLHENISIHSFIIFSRFMISSKKLEFSGVLEFPGELGTFPFTETEFCLVL